jgi:hypothetical protein
MPRCRKHWRIGLVVQTDHATKEDGLLRFLGMALAAGLIGAVLGYFEDQDPVDAMVFAAIGVGLVIWAYVNLWRKGELPQSSPVPKRYTRWALLGGSLVLIVVVGGILAFAAIEAGRDEAGFLMRDSWIALEPLSSLKGVRLGESFEDVRSRLADIEPDPDSRGGSGRHYVSRVARLRLNAEEGRITRISYECDYRDKTRVNRVSCDDARRRVLEAFGNAARRMCAKATSSNPQSDAYAFDVLDTGMRYIVLDGVVKGYVLMEPQALEAALGDDSSWRRC